MPTLKFPAATEPTRKADAPAADPAKKPTLICLVHGTFARNAAWVQSDSAFCAALRARLPEARFVDFGWSGSNHHTSRAEAGAALARKIGEEGGREGLVYFVGHSHGGNVCLHALRDPDIARAVRGIVFLGTPFFHVEQRDIQRFVSIVAPTLAWVLGLLLLTLASGLLLAGTYQVLGATGAGVAILAIAFFGLPFGETLIKRYRDWLAKRWGERLGAAAEQALDLVKASTPPCPTFVASVRIDEAGVLLRTLDLITLTPWRLFGLLAQSLFAAAAAMTVTGVIFTMIDDTILQLESWVYLAMTILAAGLVTMLGPIPIAYLVSRLRGAPFAFGGESAAMVAAVRIRPSSAPPWPDAPGSVRQEWPGKAAAGLRHSFFYADDEVIAAVAAWIEARHRCRDPLVSGAEAETTSPLSSGRTKWLFRIVPAAVVAIAFAALVAIDVARIRAPRNDPEGARPILPVAGETPVLSIERVEAERSGRAIAVGLPARIPARVPCLLFGRFAISNYVASVSLYLKPERPGGPLYGRQIWYWDAQMGQDVHFQRQLIVDEPSLLSLLATNESDYGAALAGRVYLRCRR